MKGLNVKRIAAIGLGAALVGSALAPVVSAANMVPTGLDELGRDTVITATGAPAVDVVVGANAAVSDVVWAGNIAARVAQLATKPVTCTADAGTVDLTVGGTTSMSGAGELVDTPLISLAGTQEFDMGVTNTKMPSLVNNTSFKYRWGSSTQQTGSVQETIDGNMNAFLQMETGSSRYAAGELVASIPQGALEYKVTLGTGLPLATVKGQSSLDANSIVDLTIPIMGKEYTLDEVSASGDRLVFYSSTNPTQVAVGEMLSVTGKGSYAGKTLSVKLIDLVQVGSGNTTYRAKWALMDGESVIKYAENLDATNTYDLKSEFGDIFNESIWVTAAGLNLAANTYTATVRMGSDRLEIRNGYGFPYTGESTVDTKAKWKASFDTTTLTSITISNQWRFDKTIGSETDTSKYVLKVGEAVELGNGFAKFEFQGFQEKPSNELTLGDGKLNYVDRKGRSIEVPFYKMFSVEKGKTIVVDVPGNQYTFWFEDTNFTYVEGDKSSAETQAALASVSGSQTITGFAPGTDANTVSLDLGARPYSGTTPATVDYVVDVNYITGQGFLLLGRQTFDIYSKNRTSHSITFAGTQGDNAIDEYAYYRPNMSEFIVDVLASTRSDKNYYAARFVFNDDLDMNLYVRADEAGDVWDYESLRNLDSTYNKMGPSLDAQYASWGTTAIRDGSDYLQSGFTEYGTEVVSDNSVFTLIIPEEERNVVAYLGSTNTSATTVGGSSYTGVAAGETKGNVTVTKVNCGGTGASAVEVVPISDMVKTSKGAGKSIIVGGWFANPAADVEVAPGQTLRSLLINDGDYVAAVLPSGDVLVAGKNASDTGRAASDLIAKLDAALRE